MSTFLYKAVNPQGKYTEGRLEAADPRAASFSIQNMGLIPVSIEEPRASSRSVDLSFLRLKRVSRRDILFFTEELSTLIQAGLPLDRSLSITVELTANPALKTVIRDILNEIKGGNSLADGLVAHPKHFSPLYVNMIRAGEAGGVLDVILARLAEFERSADELRSHLISSLIYPALLTMVGVGSITVLFYFVIPRFAAIFDDVGATIPPSTMLMLDISAFLRGYWWAMLAIVGATVVWSRVWLRSRGGARRWDAIKLRLPLLGPTLLKIEVGRFARTLGTLLSSAVALIPALRIGHDIVKNRIIAEAISTIADGAKGGKGVALPMQEANVFPVLAVQLVTVGEETGRLDAMLLQLADAYDKDVKTSVRALTAVFEPTIILVMGILIGTVVLSMLTAIFSINEIAF
jgi:general secretion pathway protein F